MDELVDGYYPLENNNVWCNDGRINYFIHHRDIWDDEGDWKTCIFSNGKLFHLRVNACKEDPLGQTEKQYVDCVVAVWKYFIGGKQRDLDGQPWLSPL